MSKPVWYRSLYWRIAFGFIALLAVVLAAQVLVFLWLTDRIVGPSSRSPQQLAATVAAEVGRDLEKEPTLALDLYLRREFGHIYQPFLVVLKDGRYGFNRAERLLPPGFVRAMIPRPRRGGGRGGGDSWRPGDGTEPWRGGDGGRGGVIDPRNAPPAGPPPPGVPSGEAGRGGFRPPDGRPSERPGLRPLDRPDGRPGPPDGDPRGGGHRAESAVVMAKGVEVGVVHVPAESPPTFAAVWEVGPTLAWFALGMLGVGATVTALAIFRPTHNRLRALEQAATALGQGQTEVRAAEGGGDEVSSLARTFNRMARDLETRATALSASDRARRQLLADVSHELMTPLTAIRGYTETLGMTDLRLDEPTQARYLGIIGEETQKLEGLIGDLLELARLEGGGGTLAFKDVTVAELFGRVVDRHGPTIRDRRITVLRQVEPDGLEVKGDAPRLEQAIQNLAANAIRHTPDEGTIELRAAARPEGVLITIKDSGPGIPAEHLPRIFDRFYKVDPSRTAGTTPTGSGLGLSIVQAIVERHGGRISAWNAPTGGALFEIMLPAAGRREAEGAEAGA